MELFWLFSSDIEIGKYEFLRLVSIACSISLDCPPLPVLLFLDDFGFEIAADFLLWVNTAPRRNEWLEGKCCLVVWVKKGRWSENRKSLQRNLGRVPKPTPSSSAWRGSRSMGWSEGRWCTFCTQFSLRPCLGDSLRIAAWSKEKAGLCSSGRVGGQEGELSQNWAARRSTCPVFLQKLSAPRSPGGHFLFGLFLCETSIRDDRFYRLIGLQRKRQFTYGWLKIFHQVWAAVSKVFRKTESSSCSTTSVIRNVGLHKLSWKKKSNKRLLWKNEKKRAFFATVKGSWCVQRCSITFGAIMMWIVNRMDGCLAVYTFFSVVWRWCSAEHCRTCAWWAVANLQCALGSSQFRSSAHLSTYDSWEFVMNVSKTCLSCRNECDGILGCRV